MTEVELYIDKGIILFTKHQKKASDKSMLGLSINQDSIAVAQLSDAEPQLHLDVCQYYTYRDTTDRRQILQNIAHEKKINNIPCTVILSPRHYEIHLIDQLSVADEELTQAAKWQVKDLIDCPLEDAAVEVIRIPDHGPGKQRKKMFVVVSRISYLQSLVSDLKTAKLKVSAIDIQELSLRNFALQLTKAKKSIALMTVHPDISKLIITTSDDIYLMRTFEFDWDQLSRCDPTDEKGQRLSETFIFEMKRSYDYCVSELGLTEPEQLLFAPMTEQFIPAINAINKKFTGKLAVIDINEIFKCHTPINLITQRECMTAIGGALRNVKMGTK